MAWFRIQKIKARPVILVCPKRSYRIPAYLKDCVECRFLVKRNPTHVLCGYKESAADSQKE
ncbi:MAG TPA: hypothetical protein VF234_09225 [Limnochordia bacterium]